MKGFDLAVSLLLLGSASASFADTLYDFTITGDGHTFQFTAPNPPTVTDHPHDVQSSVYGLPGTVDSKAGYTFGATVTVERNDYEFPVLYLMVNPEPPDITPFPFGLDSYDLYGPTFTKLVSDVPNPNPHCYFTDVCYDLLTFAFVPGEYLLYGYDPDSGHGDYTMDISVASSAATPEPSSFVLLGTGLLGLAGAMRRRFA